MNLNARNDVNCKPSPSVYSCKSFITDGNGHKFKDKSVLLFKILINILSGRFFSSCSSLICKTKFEYRNQIQHHSTSSQHSRRWWWWILDEGMLTILTWAACFVGGDAWVHVSSGEARTHATHRRPVTSRGDIYNEGGSVQGPVWLFLFVWVSIQQQTGSELRMS